MLPCQVCKKNRASCKFPPKSDGQLPQCLSSENEVDTRNPQPDSSTNEATSQGDRGKADTRGDGNTQAIRAGADFQMRLCARTGPGEDMGKMAGEGNSLQQTFWWWWGDPFLETRHSRVLWELAGPTPHLQHQRPETRTKHLLPPSQTSHLLTHLAWSKTTCLLLLE